MAIQWIKILLAAAVGLPHMLSSAVLLPTPPMGFNGWSAFMCGVTETVIVNTAEAMVQNGMLAAGYNRINLDDCWSSKTRTDNGSLTWDTTKFPSGLPALATWLKSIGFIPGIYADAGNTTCGGYPGSYGNIDQDVETFSSWGFEYVKVDGCSMTNATEPGFKKAYRHWQDSLSGLANPMIFSQSGPAYFSGEANLTDWYLAMNWASEYGQLARHSSDTLVANSTLYYPTIRGWDSVMYNYGQEVRLARYQKPGFFNDPDFLNVDHSDYTMDERKSHFAIWASLSAPLIISAYIPYLSTAEIQYLTNKELIAINQDALALQATLVSQDGTFDVLTKNLANGDRLLTIINRGTTSKSYNVTFERLGIPDVPTVIVRHIWTANYEYASKAVIAASIPAHGTGIMRISPVNGTFSVIPTGMIFNTYSLNSLTATTSGLAWAASAATNGQIWQTKNDSTITSPYNPGECLTDAGSGSVIFSSCVGTLAQEWHYLSFGTLKNQNSGWCLTEGPKGSVITSACLNEDNTQVFGLPSGVIVRQP